MDCSNGHILQRLCQCNGVNSDGNLFVTGGTDGGLDGNVNSGGTDIFLFKLNSSGTKL